MTTTALNLTTIKNFFSRKNTRPSIRSLIRLESFLDYYLPDIIKSLIYTGLTTSLAVQIYNSLFLSTFKWGVIVVTIFLSVTAYFSKNATVKNNTNLLLPLVLVLFYEKIVVELVIINEAYLYAVIPVAFFYFFSKCKSYKERVEQLCRKYSKIDKMSEDDFNYLLKNTSLYLNETKDLINIAHYNGNFNWLEQILNKTKIRLNSESIFYKVVPFLWLSPEEGYKIVKKYKILSGFSNQNVFYYLFLINTALTHDDIAIANEISYELLANNNDITFIRKTVALQSEKVLSLEAVGALIEKTWLELNLGKTNTIKTKRVKV